MLSSKELYRIEHERLTALLEDDGADYDTAYEATADAAFDAARERFADMVDAARDARREAL